MDIAKARKILEEDGKKLTDEQVQQYITTAELLSTMAFDAWNKLTPEERKRWRKKKQTKSNRKRITSKPLTNR